jgi:glycosyltransferase involved in cell wall biosynthesis
MTIEKKESRILIGVPCLNEEKTISKVILDFKEEFPGARILVIDNDSKDQTAIKAKEAGAEVIFEKKQGKGYAVQKIFDNFNEDILVLVDGDGTYNPRDTKKLIELLGEGADMAVGNRVHFSNMQNFKFGHWLGNKFLTGIVNLLFGTRLQDIESGLRVVNKKYVQSSALLAGGFGIEPELTIQALEKNFVIREIPITFKNRPLGSSSKLSALKDGMVVVYTILSLFRDNRPLQFFILISVLFLLVSVFFGRLATNNAEFTYTFFFGIFILLSFVSFIAGLILSSLKRKHEELIVLLRRKNKLSKK